MFSQKEKVSLTFPRIKRKLLKDIFSTSLENEIIRLFSIFLIGSR